MEEMEEIGQNLKQTIYKYYMGYIQEKFTFLEDTTRERIGNAIRRLLDQKLEKGNARIDKEEMIQILTNIMQKELSDPMISSMRQRNINETFPKVATVTIEDSQVVSLEEVNSELFQPDERKVEYLYVANQYYKTHIEEIENRIKQLEKTFSSKELENFDEQFNKDTTIKEYELQSAKEYENEQRQIAEKEKKFDAIKQKVIYDYGRRYQEIIAKDIPEAKKQALLKQLLEETKSYDKKTNEVAIQLEQEKAKLFRKFENRAKRSNEIMDEMIKMHLFDREKYLQDRKGDANPELASLYAKREQLNAYRKEHGEAIYEVKPNTITNILNTIARNKRGEHTQLLLEYDEQKEIPTGINPILLEKKEGVDEKLIQTLAHLYAEKVNEKQNNYFMSEQQEEQTPIDTTRFEAHLVRYFRAHYKDLMQEGYHHFLSDFVKMPDDIGNYDKKEGELVKIAKQYGIDPKKLSSFGYQFSIRDGLLYETEMNELRKVHYATDKGINDIIEDLYSQILYMKHTNVDSFAISNKSKLKNGFVQYAKEHGIKIEKEYALEKMEVNQNKVEDISRYINQLINKRLSKTQENYEITDYTEILSKDITENYSTIMNLDFYSFGKLESVRNIIGDQYIDGASLRINEDCILRTDDFNPYLVYATEEYCTREYSNIMEKIHTLNATSDSFLDGIFDFIKANALKTSLRNYIKEHGMDIDISVEQVPIDYEKIDLIADTMIKTYGDKARNIESFRDAIVKKLQDNWSEIVTEEQVVRIGKMFEEELKEGTFVMEDLYVRDDFIYLGDSDHYHSECIYATEESLKERIEKLEDTINKRDDIMSRDEKRARSTLIQYAQKNKIPLEQNKTTIKERIAKHERRRLEEHSRFGGLMADYLPDDPTAREKINLNDNLLQVIIKMSEGNPGAITALTTFIKDNPEDSFMLILGLDDMNIRGSQIWQIYKYYCEEDIEKFRKVIKDRDADMIQYLNEQSAVEGNEKAVSGGASFDRSKKPHLYRFTEEEVELYREAREERLQKAREERARVEKEQQKEPKKKNRYIRKIQKRKGKVQDKKEKITKDRADDEEER